MIYCGKAKFGQISRSFALNSGAIRLKRPKNLTQICFPSLRSVKSDRLLGTPNPVNLKYRDLIKQIVKELVDTGTSKETTAEKIDELLGTKPETNDRSEVKHAIETELICLHEGNIARFRLTLPEFQRWKANW